MRADIFLEANDVNDTSAFLFSYAYGNGDYVEKGMLLLQTETSKNIREVTAIESGYVLYNFAEGDEVPIGTAIVSIFDTETAYNNFVQTKSDLNNEHLDDIVATEKAKALAKEGNIDLSDIIKDGIIKESDVMVYIENKHKSTATTGPVYRYDKERIVIIGAGKGAEVLIDILDDHFDKQVVLLVDDKVREFSGYKVSSYRIYEFADLADRSEFDTAIISLSANRNIMKLRAKFFEYYRARGIEFTNIIAKSAEIRRNVKIGQGNIIGANVYIGTESVLGDNNAISYNAVIGHHNHVGNCNLLAPGIMTSGSVSIGNDCIIPAGVNFINGVKVGSNVVLPVGYNVCENINNNTFIK